MYGERILKELKAELIMNKELVSVINNLLAKNPWNGSFGGASYFIGYIARIEVNDSVEIYVKYKDKGTWKEVTVEELFEKEAGAYSPTRAREVYILPFKARIKSLIKRAKKERDING